MENCYYKTVKLLNKDSFPLSPNLCLWNFAWRVGAGSRTPAAVGWPWYCTKNTAGNWNAMVCAYLNVEKYIVKVQCKRWQMAHLYRALTLNGAGRAGSRSGWVSEWVASECGGLGHHCPIVWYCKEKHSTMSIFMHITCFCLLIFSLWKIQGSRISRSRDSSITFYKYNILSKVGLY